jgi:hypothetical protein
MSKTIELTWEQEMLIRGQVLGERNALRVLLEKRFGPLPPAMAQRIEAIDDLERLRALFQQALEVSSLAELEL